MLSEKKKFLTILILTIAFLAYSFYLYLSLPATSSAIAKEAGEGKLVWQQYNCIACHQVYGLGGYLGPDLTNTYSLKGPAYIRAFLESGTDIMPNFHFSKEEVNALLAYMQDIDASGKADPRTFTINTDGTIEQ